MLKLVNATPLVTFWCVVDFEFHMIWRFVNSDSFLFGNLWEYC